MLVSPRTTACLVTTKFLVSFPYCNFFTTVKTLRINSVYTSGQSWLPFLFGCRDLLVFRDTTFTLELSKRPRLLKP